MSVIVVLAIIIFFIMGLSKIFSIYSKLDTLFLKMGSIEEELRKLSEQIKGVSPESIVPPESKQLDDLQSVTEKSVQEKVVSEEVTETVEIFSNLEKDGLSAKEELVPEPIFNDTQIATVNESQTADKLLLAQEKVLVSAKDSSDTPNLINQRPLSDSVPRKKSAFELFFSENLLTKIGVITFVLGIGFFVKYAIDQEWINEVGRVGIGMLTGALMIGIAHRLRKSLSVFSSLLVGGGISVFYITITLAFREYELFSQTIAFVILILITGFSVALSLLYNRKELAVFSLLGGFIAPLLVSTGTGNYVVLFSYILILNSGMLYLSFKKNWVVIGYVAFILTAIFKITWVANGFIDQYLGASLFSAMFFIQFYIVALINTSKDKRIAPHIIMIILNNMVYLGIFLGLFEEFVAVNLKGLIVMAFALVNLLVLLYLWKKKKINSLYLYTVLGIVVSLITLAVPVQLNGHYVTMFWAIEIVVLLVLYFKSKLKIFYTGFIVISILALISYLIDVSVIDKVEYATLIFNKLFVTGFVVFTSFFVAYTLLQRNNVKTYIIGFLTYVLRVLAFVVPVLEVDKELQFLAERTPIGAFDMVVLTIYCLSYAAILFSIISKSKLNYIVNWIVLVVCSMLLWGGFSDLRTDIFIDGLLNANYFLVTFLAIPGLVVLVRQLYTNKTYVNSPKVIRWLLPLIVLILLCVFIDNSTVLLNGMQRLLTYEEYNALLNTTHIITYPIVWAGIALLMTYLGVKKQLVFLRQIALALLGLTIVKFYILDVWSMGEGGKVLSFVLLGLIILVIAFLLNRIKGLLGQTGKEVDHEKQEETSESSSQNDRE